MAISIDVKMKYSIHDLLGSYASNLDNFFWREVQSSIYDKMHHTWNIPIGDRIRQQSEQFSQIFYGY